MTQEERRRFFKDFDASLAELQKNPGAWKLYQEELKIWEVTLADGLPQDEVWDPVARIGIATGGRSEEDL